MLEIYAAGAAAVEKPISELELSTGVTRVKVISGVCRLD